MRKIGFGLRFSALVIDVSLIIVIVFGLYFAFGKSLYTSIGIIKKQSVNINSSVSSIITKSHLGQAANNNQQSGQSNTANTGQNSNTQNQNNRSNNSTSEQTQDLPTREQRTRNALPNSTPLPTEQGNQSTIRPERNIDRQAEKIPRGYIHNSKDFVKIFFFAVISILFFLSEGLFGLSVGKLILRLKILTPEREEATRKSLLIRYALKIAIPCFIILIYSLTKVNFFWILGMIWFFLVTVGCFFVFSDSMQTLHDKISETAVFSLYLKEEEPEEIVQTV